MPEVQAGAVGFKLLNNDARQDYLSDARCFLQRIGVKVIHLCRKNLLRQFTSLCMALKTDVWVLLPKTVKPVELSVKLNPTEMFAFLENVTEVYEWNKKELADCQNIVVWYEDLLSDYENSMQKITEFLDVPYANTIPETIRQETRPLGKIIENFSEIHNALAGTIWEGFLE